LFYSFIAWLLLICFSRRFCFATAIARFDNAVARVTIIEHRKAVRIGDLLPKSENSIKKMIKRKRAKMQCGKIFLIIFVPLSLKNGGFLPSSIKYSSCVFVQRFLVWKVAV